MSTVIGLVIFDCDGVLVDSDPIFFRVLSGALTAAGNPTTAASAADEFAGMTLQQIAHHVESACHDELPATWLREFEAAVISAFKEELQPVAGVKAALESIPYPICVASNSTRAKVRLTLALTGLDDYFGQRVFSIEEVARGKPHPDLFLYAAELLAVPAAACVVIEDSASGVLAAQAAAMPVFGFAAGRSEHAVGAADVVFDDMECLPSLLEEFCVRVPGS